MEWGFIWLMFVLKIPIFMLFGIVYWAWKQTPELDDEGADDGGSHDRPEPPVRRPRRPRGPHGEPAPLPGPPRVRTPAVRSRRTERQS